jgi:hypothetical protein
MLKIEHVQKQGVMAPERTIFKFSVPTIGCANVVFSPQLSEVHMGAPYSIKVKQRTMSIGKGAGQRGAWGWAQLGGLINLGSAL